MKLRSNKCKNIAFGKSLIKIISTFLKTDQSPWLYNPSIAIIDSTPINWIKLKSTPPGQLQAYLSKYKETKRPCIFLNSPLFLVSKNVIDPLRRHRKMERKFTK